MQIKGVSEEELSIISSIIEPYRHKYDFFCYGSRVKGDYRFLSDLDLMIKCKSEFNLSDVESLKIQFDNSNLPYVVNISNYENMNEDFYKLIEPGLVKI